jgi:hypothetical protein
MEKARRIIEKLSRPLLTDKKLTPRDNFLDVRRYLTHVWYDNSLFLRLPHAGPKMQYHLCFRYSNICLLFRISIAVLYNVSPTQVQRKNCLFLILYRSVRGLKPDRFSCTSPAILFLFANSTISR